MCILSNIAKAATLWPLTGHIDYKNKLTNFDHCHGHHLDYDDDDDSSEGLYNTNLLAYKAN